jgi:prepilin-type N-terminal cleavage/methylation domain-containing protein
MTGKYDNQGFTIVELLVVIIVIGILAAITMVSYSGITTRANTAVVQSDLDNIARRLEMYKIDNGQYPATSTELTLIPGYAISKGNTLLSYVSNKTNPNTLASLGDYYCITINIDKIAYSKSNKTTPIPGYCMTNLIVNGDFSSGITGWSSTNGTITNNAGVGQNTATGTFTDQDYVQNLTPIIDVSSRSYIGFSQRSNSFDFQSSYLTGDYPGGTYSDHKYSGGLQNTWYANSLPETDRFDNQNKLVIRTLRRDSAAIAGGSISQLDNVICIDMTRTFGVGNVPNDTKMNTIMSQFGANPWFEGTVIVSL